MASFTTSNVSTNTTVGRELSIASSFVKQYYTLLNKAPCFIHNFYSHDSTFIHGTIEMANDYYTEPVVGREKIKKKMDDLKLNDCRAKIKQIDCLATLAGGLVIQVIGELSNNGRPMRRFLQTFVLAPSPDETRQEGDSHHARPTDRRNVHSDENNSSSQNQKFFVLNSIFRYQDEGPENEFEDDVASINASVSVDGSNGGSDMSKVDSVGKQSVISAQPNGSVSDYSQNRRLKASENVRGGVDEVERLANDLEEGTKLKKSSNEPDFKRESSGQKVVSNGTGNLDKKNETSEKPTENGKTAPDHSQPANALSGPGIETTKQPSPAVVATRPPPSYEPKTWANMVRNNTQSSASVQLANVNKPAVAPAAASVAAAAAVTEQQQHQNVTQTSSVQAHPQQQQHHQQQNQHHHQQQQQHQQQHPQQQPQQQQSPQQQQQLQQQGSQNPRRRNMMRKPSNKSTGRSLKNRPPRPMTGNPGTTGGKPIA